MRTLLVILLVPVFALVFLFAITINQIVSTVSSEDLVVRILDDVEKSSMLKVVQLPHVIL